MMALTLWAFRHSNSSSKSFVGLSLDPFPLMPQYVDESDALVRGHLAVRFAIGFIRLGKRRELADSNLACHVLDYTAPAGHPFQAQTSD